jgi:predicted nucleotidyltransferase
MKGKKLEKIKPILEDVKKALKKIYGKQLKSIILFGSYARADSTEGSDIDIIVLLDGIEDPVTEKEKFFDAIWQLDLKYDTVISVLPFDENQYKTRRLPVILNAKREGISI